VTAGESNKSIARKLWVSVDTVQHPVSHVFDELGVFSRYELVFAFDNDLVRDVADFSADLLTPPGTTGHPRAARVRRIKSEPIPNMNQ
jgi:hypothetical protein